MGSTGRESRRGWPISYGRSGRYRYSINYSLVNNIMQQDYHILQVPHKILTTKDRAHCISNYQTELISTYICVCVCLDSMEEYVDLFESGSHM